MPIGDLTIRGHACSRADQHEIAFLQLRYWDRFSLVTVMDALGGIRHQFCELIECTRCLSHGTHLQPVTE
jgi:hypothetical protein